MCTFLPQEAVEFDDLMKRVLRDHRGVAVFVPTRAEVEQIAKELGEPQDSIPLPRRRSRSGSSAVPRRSVRRPFLLAMTAAGQSALNIRSLDTV